MAESFKTEIFELDGKNISITTSATESLPLVLINTFAGEADSLWKECAALHCPHFTLACISGMDWNADLSPWEIPPLRKNEPPFSGKADSYLAFIVEQALPVILQKLSPPPYIALAGYSLAGLFALYAPYRTKIFSKIAAASPSVWYPKFIDFAKNSSFTNKPECIYLSLGDKESKTKNQRLASVQNNIIQLAEVYQSKNITTCFELNSGNHFTETDLRMAKAIKWILEK
ncbi:alpha/beta hydrolase-fold protein [Treponema sp.]|uniref:alpha/beta hydrolase n=1 Tax=Treponema sp. TaxID=166 RepID=UPI00257B8667|nr:alpha/beta hydrolase-fold protein [Treponema sp.]MBE6355102.1 alpha/beta hydrolase [Treponema sp.]